MKKLFCRFDVHKLASLIIIFWFLANASMVVAANSNEIKIMPLGDSITNGDSNGCYRQNLYLNLIDAGFDVDFVGSQSYPSSPDPPFDTDHEGHSGWCAYEIRDNVYDWLELNPADFVLLHIGTNDVALGTEDVNEIAEILDEIDRYETNYARTVRVFLARIILRSDDSALNETTKDFNNAVDGMAQARISNGDDITIVDMENALIYPDDMRPADGEHPNGVGYEKMADVWYTAVYNELITNRPVANFYASHVSGFEQLTVSFSDASTSNAGVISWLWDFGDGETSSDPNPAHVYGEGTYTVSLTVEEADGDSDTETKTDYITVKPPNSPPIANFNIQSSAKPAINEEISFIDQSSDTDGTVTSWSWIFGDGTTSSTQNATHKYQSIGNYTVSLTIEDDAGATSTQTKQITIYEIDVTNPDSDGDGIPDEWELLHGLDPLNPSDASSDRDGDGISNLEEYQMENGIEVHDFPDLTLSIVLVIAVFFLLIFVVFYTRKLRKRKN